MICGGLLLEMEFARGVVGAFVVLTLSVLSGLAFGTFKSKPPSGSLINLTDPPRPLPEEM